ncbi:MAG: aminotransferase class III-fold pyridoxal phosphate-dependent enzyme [Pseudomonadota bacterium]
MSAAALIERRERLLGPGNPLFYDEPLHLVRGEGVWLFDADGQRYLDCYNNVPCVGHCHPRVVDALCEQARRLNTHTRYLHATILDYAERLLAKFAPSLDRLALACTGSEANDLAMRAARATTGGTGFICTHATYHGNTTAVSQFSGIYEPIGGTADWVRKVPWPDSYRGTEGLSDEALAETYAADVAAAVESLNEGGHGVAAMLICPIFANEGLPDVPAGYLEKVAAIVRAAGGLLIFDEVQSGFGRIGRWWGYEQSGVVPDVVTLGKPMAGGHPVSGVVERGDVIDEYRRQEMYFNTFGGNPVSCASALAVLDVLESEGLVENAATVGAYTQAGLRALKERHAHIGDVRGSGLFFGVELVSDRAAKTPDPEAARAVVNGMRARGVLMSKIGEHGNVLKLRPPLSFSKANADQMLEALDAALGDVGGNDG